MTTRTKRENRIRLSLERIRVKVAALDTNIELLLDFEDDEERDIEAASHITTKAVYRFNQLNWRLYRVVHDWVPRSHPDEPFFYSWARDLEHLRPLNRPRQRIGRAYRQYSGQRTSGPDGAPTLSRRRRAPRVFVARPSPTLPFRLTPQELEEQIRVRVAAAAARRIARRIPAEPFDLIEASDPDGDSTGPEDGEQY